jgi:hypothetical protein
MSILNRQTAYEWYRASLSWHAPQLDFAARQRYLERCRKRPPTEVHHLTYERVFNELPSDLLAYGNAMLKFTGGNQPTIIRYSSPSIFPRRDRRSNVSLCSFGSCGGRHLRRPCAIITQRTLPAYKSHMR